MIDPRAAYVAAARTRAEALYAGVRTPHRSCGIALAETFGLPSGSYQALRKGGLTGEGPCGAIAAGLLVLGELLGDPSPTGPPTDALRTAAARYRAGIAAKVDHGVDTACNTRTARFPSFGAPARLGYCTSLAALVAETVAEVTWDAGVIRAIPPAPWEPTGE
ncbi:MAG: hypothetical protein Q8P41_24265 [Pseudomonadota bacterium]|nr:hypothetical protein [Pseudomonadota bacterium]